MRLYDVDPGRWLTEIPSDLEQSNVLSSFLFRFRELTTAIYTLTHEIDNVHQEFTPRRVVRVARESITASGTKEFARGT